MKLLQRFRRNRSGVAYLWAVAACSLLMFPIIYWALSVGLDTVATAIFAQYTFTGNPANAWTLCKALISALPVFVLIIVGMWVWVNSKAQAYEQ